MPASCFRAISVSTTSTVEDPRADAVAATRCTVLPDTTSVDTAGTRRNAEPGAGMKPVIVLVSRYFRKSFLAQ